MSDIYRCENCLFSVQAVPVLDEQKEFGNLLCRRYPPQPVYDGEIGFARSALVPVNHNWWCGEWRSKEIKIMPRINVDELLNNIPEPFWKRWFR